MTTPLPFGAGAGGPPPDELLLTNIARPIVRRWRLVLAVPLATAGLALLLAVVWPRSYMAQASFTPEQPSGATGSAIASAIGSIGSLGGLMGSVGGVPTSLASGGSTSPDFFVSLLQSRELLTATLTSAFDDPAEPGRRRPLVELLRPRGGTAARRMGNAVRKLEKQAAPSVDRRAGIVSLRVTLPDPELAAAVANRMTELLNQYNLERRQFSSREQRRFISGRLAQAEQELRTAERAESAFLVQNRGFAGSPRLEEQALRLAREVRVQQDVVLGLRKSFEDARIAEVRDTPVLTIVDHAAPPDRPANPKPVLWAVLGGIVGGFGVLVYVFTAAARTRAARVAESAAHDPVPSLPATRRDVLVGADDRSPSGDVWSPARRP